MFLLVTGAGGMGKSTACRHVEAELGDVVRCAELRDVADVPAVPTIAWRHRATEAAAQAALASDRPHFLLAACLLDARPDVQTARLAARGDDPALLPHHVAFADWMRRHAHDPQHMQHVLTGDGWEEMEWSRWTGMRAGDERWQVTVLDTSDLTPEEVGAGVVTWAREAIAGRAPRLHTPEPGFT